MATNTVFMRCLGVFRQFSLNGTFWQPIRVGIGGASHMDPVAMGEIKETLPAQI